MVIEKQNQSNCFIDSHFLVVILYKIWQNPADVGKIAKFEAKILMETRELKWFLEMTSLQ